MKNQNIENMRIRIQRCATNRGTGRVILSKSDCEALCYLWNKELDAFLSKDRITALHLVDGGKIFEGMENPSIERKVLRIDVDPDKGGAIVYFAEKGDHPRYTMTVRPHAIVGVVTREE